jgi:lactoylglutathione lyase
MIKFGHINLITNNWRRLAAFYISVFECVALAPTRNLKGKWLDKATTIKNSHIRGVHLLLPGFNSNPGPTLEIFQYSKNKKKELTAINKTGFGHIAFKTNNINLLIERLLKHGGTLAGEKVSVKIKGAGNLTFVYAKDIDGNVIELQQWY